MDSILRIAVILGVFIALSWGVRILLSQSLTDKVLDDEEVGEE